MIGFDCHIGDGKILSMGKAKYIPDLFAYAEDNRPAIVYAARNIITGGLYIGVTRLPLEKRRYTHFINAKRNDARHGPSKFYAAIRKYGRDVFEFSVVAECASYREALDVERNCIAKYEPSYNLTAGGEGVLGHRHSAASKRKMSKAKKGKSPWPAGEYPTEVRGKISAALKGRKYKPSGKQLVAMQVNAAKANDGRRRAVIYLNTGRMFASVTEAAEHFGVTTSHITVWCKGVKSRVGHRFAYAEKAAQT